MGKLLLFVAAIILCGAGGVGGSIVGNAFGKTGLWVGGVVGGLVGASITSWVAAKMGWIGQNQRARTSLWTALGFLAAAGIAVNTLSSPIGPISSTLLCGIGALIGSSGKRKDEL